MNYEEKKLLHFCIIQSRGEPTMIVERAGTECVGEGLDTDGFGGIAACLPESHTDALSRRLHSAAGRAAGLSDAGRDGDAGVAGGAAELRHYRGGLRVRPGPDVGCTKQPTPPPGSVKLRHSPLFGDD